MSLKENIRFQSYYPYCKVELFTRIHLRKSQNSESTREHVNTALHLVTTGFINIHQFSNSRSSLGEIRASTIIWEIKVREYGPEMGPPGGPLGRLKEN
jgi:hypothetical protein